MRGVRCGCDVVDVARFGAMLGRRQEARRRLFTPYELAESVRDGVHEADVVAIRRLAARYAAKEAAVKLWGRPTELRWTDLEVRTCSDGAPQLWLHGAPTDVAVSLSHDGETAVALVACHDGRTCERTQHAAR